jgi:hypothetical protein
MRAETLNSQEVLLPTWARKAATFFKLQPQEFAVGGGGTKTIRLVVIRSGDERMVVPEIECMDEWRSSYALRRGSQTGWSGSSRK